MRSLLALLICCILCGGCSSSENMSTTQNASSDPGYVSRKMIGKSWPLTVEDGIIENHNSAVTFTSGGTTYTVNGTAKMRKLGRPIEEIWAKGTDGIMPRMDISPILDRGLKLPPKD